MTDINKNAAQAVINEAREEIAREVAERNKDAYKKLLKQKALAQTALDNINREIEDAEQAMRQGNDIV